MYLSIVTLSILKGIFYVILLNICSANSENVDWINGSSAAVSAGGISLHSPPFPAAFLPQEDEMRHEQIVGTLVLHFKLKRKPVHVIADFQWSES